MRDRRLWPIAVVLVIATAGVPVLLKRSAKQPSVPPTAAAGLPTSLPAGPAVSTDTSPGQSKLRGQGRDPFIQQVAASTAAAGTAASAASGVTGTAGTTGVAGSTVSTGTTSSGLSGSGTTPTTSGGGSALPTAPPTTPTTTTTTTSTTTTSQPTGLTSTQSYSVSLAISNSSGGFDTIDPLVRLSPVPSQKQPLLVELGVLEGGHRVLFLVQPGTVVTGPGTCTPGAIDCAILSLGENQTENVSRTSGTDVVPVGSFAVTAISTDQHSSRADADTARQAESAFGRKLVDASTADALSLFRYEPGVGAVVDLRNLTVGGS